MGISTHVEGVILADEAYKLKHEAFKALEKAGVSIPDELQDYADLHGEIVDIGYTEYEGEMCEVLEVDIRDLPDGVNIIRFTNSW